jgi:NADPH-dependent 2,4-dienoyl-CoA reductase/sulfur reductase-like enzyme
MAALFWIINSSNLLAADKSYDVVVVGAGTGGVAASIQAARQGVHVALLEETDWIGGQMSAAAVSTMDELGKLGGPQGIYSEF